MKDQPTDITMTAIDEHLGWVKLYRDFFNQPVTTTAQSWFVYSYLLSQASRKKMAINTKGGFINPGQVLTSARKISEALRLRQGTVADVLKWLVQIESITIRPINPGKKHQASIITIIGWDEMQGARCYAKCSDPDALDVALDVAPSVALSAAHNGAPNQRCSDPDALDVALDGAPSDELPDALSDTLQERRNMRGKKLENLTGATEVAQESARDSFVPPTEEDVIQYLHHLKGSDKRVEPKSWAKKFVAYYTDRNWRQKNGKPIKDWKRAVVTWMKREKGDAPDEQYSELFLECWNAYPRKERQKESYQMFLRVENKLPDDIVDRIKRVANSPNWKRDGGKYIPSFPKWLEGERWNDGMCLPPSTSQEAANTTYGPDDWRNKVTDPEALEMFKGSR